MSTPVKMRRELVGASSTRTIGSEPGSRQMSSVSTGGLSFVTTLSTRMMSSSAPTRAMSVADGSSSASAAVLSSTEVVVAVAVAVAVAVTTGPRSPSMSQLLLARVMRYIWSVAHLS
jgi:hypothetical protein